MMTELKFLFDTIQPILVIIVAVWMAGAMINIVNGLLHRAIEPDTNNSDSPKRKEKPKRQLVLSDDGEVSGIDQESDLAEYHIIR